MNVNCINVNSNPFPPTYCFLVKHNEGYLLVDSGTPRAADSTVSQLSSLIEPQQLTHILLTHHHLDHAGAVADIMQWSQDCLLVGHSSCVRQLLFPKLLNMSTQQVFGKERFEILFGTSSRIDKKRVMEIDKHHSLTIGGQQIIPISTHGHCSHHISYHFTALDALFSGDALGAHYGNFFMPLTPPPEFIAEYYRQAARELIGLNTAKVYMSHGGETEEQSGVIDDFDWYFDYLFSICKPDTAIDDIEEMLFQAVKNRISEAKLIDSYIRHEVNLNLKAYAQHSDTIRGRANE